MQFEPFTQNYTFNTDVLIEDFPDYLLPHVQRWVRQVMVMARISTGTSLTPSFKRDLEFRIRSVLPTQATSFVARWTENPGITCDLLTLMLQNYSTEEQVVELVNLLRVNSSAYTAEPTAQGPTDGKGGYILVRRVPDAVRQQAEIVLSANELMRNAWNECYKMPPNYTEAVRLCSDFMEGLLRDKFWSGRERPYTVGQAVDLFAQDDSILHYKAESFLSDKTQVIALLKGIANIRGEHTTGQGREPTPDEAEFIVQTTIYLYTLLEPVVPTNN